MRACKRGSCRDFEVVLLLRCHLLTLGVHVVLQVTLCEQLQGYLGRFQAEADKAAAEQAPKAEIAPLQGMVMYSKKKVHPCFKGLRHAVGSLSQSLLRVDADWYSPNGPVST